MEDQQQPTIYQKLKKKESNSLDIAYTYYSILSSINRIKLTEREIQLIAFAAIKGNISSFTYKEEFCKLYNSSAPTINNMVSKLKKLGILIKESNKVKVNPKILLDFDKNIILQVNLYRNG
jgi:hypothetical protein